MFSNWECSSGNQQWTFDFNTCQWVNAETNECQSDNPFLIEAKNHNKDWKGRWKMKEKNLWMKIEVIMIYLNCEDLSI